VHIATLACLLPLLTCPLPPLPVPAFHCTSVGKKKDVSVAIQKFAKIVSD
jgi:hypothetical protein